MPEPSVVRARREGDVGAKPPAGGHAMDIVLSVVAVVALASLGFVGFKLWAGPPSAQSAVMASDAVVLRAGFTLEDWTEEDTASCEQKARAASRAPVPGEMAFANPAVTGGFAGLATLLECRLTTKVMRLCDPAEKTAIIEAVKDYLGRIDITLAALNLQGAPMSIMGDMMGGEVAAGSAIYDMQKDATIDFMEFHHKRVVAALQALARSGVVAASDFGSFMGMGVPPMIKKMLDGVTASRNLCS